ncbi:DUF6879 family protein [Streptomyces sp. NPDC087851]|uniref:DUF6879 family protein n=1 Tax=Streptomyces sp. NPDC087851 TaxID=3365810 RepID=UPI0038283FA2
MAPDGPGPCGSRTDDDPCQDRLPTLTPYSRYLFDWCIPGNVAAGEDYRMVDVTSRPNPGVPEQDFWLFDEAVVVHLNYRPDGTQINRALIQEPDIGKYLAWRDLAMESAVPFSAYRA